MRRSCLLHEEHIGIAGNCIKERQAALKREEHNRNPGVKAGIFYDVHINVYKNKTYCRTFFNEKTTKYSDNA